MLYVLFNILFLITSKFNHRCTPLKFVPPVLVGGSFPFFRCKVDQSSAHIHWVNNEYCIATNDCSSINGPLRPISQPLHYNDDKKTAVNDLGVSSDGALKVEIKAVPGSCEPYCCSFDYDYYTPDIVFFDGVEIKCSNAHINCSLIDGNEITLFLTNQSSTTSQPMQYPPSGLTMRISHSELFQCFFSGVGSKEISYHKLGTNTTREFDQNLTPGRWNCSVGNRSALFDYVESLVIDNDMKDCVVLNGGSCWFTTSIRSLDRESTRGGLHWTIDGKIMHEWDNFSQILLRNIKESASIQCFAYFISNSSNITATSSSRMIVVEMPSTFLHSPKIAFLKPNKSMALECLVPIDPILTNLSHLNFYHKDEVITSSDIYQLSPITGNIKRTMKILTQNVKNLDSIAGIYYCVLESRVFGRIKSPPFEVKYMNENNRSGRIIAICLIVLLAIVSICWAVKICIGKMGESYSLIDPQSQSHDGSNCFEMKSEKKPFLKNKDKIFSDDDIADEYQNDNFIFK